MKKRGKIKYSDPSKGYGYILPDDAASPSDAVLFGSEATAEEIGELVVGTDVDFEVDEKKAPDQATRVEKA